MPVAFDKTLAELEKVACDHAGPEAILLVRKALAGRKGILAAKAAKIIARCGWKDLIPDLIASFGRFFENPIKTDPQCWAKTAIVEALAKFEADEPEIYTRGLRHVQMEPIWGGSADSAGPLRAQCAVALAQCRTISDLQVLLHLTDVLADADKTVRMAAANAVASIGRLEGALLLRLRVLSGEQEPEVLETLFSGMLHINRRENIPFVSRFLGADSEIAAEAALALGLTHDPEAFEVLRQKLPSVRDHEAFPAFFRAIALTRLPEAIELLIGMVEQDEIDARYALEALRLIAIPEEARIRLERAVAG